jgi:hypothetical protein
MGTHNLLLRLGEAMYLEVIAVKPGAAKPSRPRWFALDELPHDAKPRLACWVARTDDINELISTVSEKLGRIEPMSRGSLSWLISIPEDGSLPLGGAAPALIQWHTSAHPAASLQDQGCSLVGLDLLHPEPKRLSALLSSLCFSEPSLSVSIIESPVPALVAHIRTPQGIRSIRGI